MLPYPKIYTLALGRSKWYHIALAQAHQILAKLPSADDHCMLITYHRNQPESYYKGLVMLTDAAKLSSLMRFADQNTHNNKECELAVLSLIEDGKGASANDPSLAVPALPAPDPEDCQSIHGVARQVLQCLPSSQVDISSRFHVRVEGRIFKLCFDSCSHASGKQREYVACPARHHTACFRYGIVEQRVA